MSSFIIRRNIRLFSSVSRNVLRQSSYLRTNSAKISLASRFFNSSAITQNYSEIKQALFNKLESEIEVENQSPVKLSDIDSQFLKELNFEITHNVGEKIVTLTKNIPDGKLHVYFDCTELNDIQTTSQHEQEEVIEDEQEDEIEFDEQLENSLLNVNIIVENTSTNESLVAHSYLSYDELEFFPQSFQIIKDIKLANSLDAESQQIKLSKYNGPGFQMLDEEVQELFEAFFAELGCNEQLGEFIVNYSTITENDEYINWLNDLKKFFN